MIIACSILILLVLAVRIVAFICYRMAFYADRKPSEEEYPIPEGEIYEPYREQMVALIRIRQAHRVAHMMLTTLLLMMTINKDLYYGR